MTGWLVPVIAAFAALVAYLQWITAHQKIVLELFEKRLEAFRDIQKAIVPIMRNGAITNEEFFAFAAAVERCRFLFGDDVHHYLAGLRERLAFMSAFTDQIIDGRDEPERSRLIDKKYDYLLDVANFETEGVPLFTPYIKLDQKMRYFWPIESTLRARE
ncbi:hypothetical protein AB7645_05440 [Bradyrhizobium sp. 956_D2_N1_5]|uniref:hypothetical protein n=1 Tax=unclassified Bradyrhizobium TaxID=2631580 RepID=UPI003F203A9D